jgi:RNA polymerase sigma factor (sigma-70 family)
MTSVISTAILRTQTDERLVALSRTGHQRAFEAIVERYRAELTRSLRRLLPSGSVEDALQQTHLQAWKALAGGTDVRELRAWLHRIARNAAIAVASRGYDYDELQDALLVTPGPEDDLERREAVRRTLRGIAELPERQREALLAVAVGGRSHADVALDLGITDSAARQLLHRARVALLAVASLATPPQLVRWAARAGHGALAGKAAAGTGLGGGLAASAGKVGVSAIAVAVGGVAAAGIGPIHHTFDPAATKPSPAHHHRRVHAAAPSARLAAAVTTPPLVPAVVPAAHLRLTPAPKSASERRASVHHVRRVRAEAIGKVAPPSAPPAAVVPSVQPTPTPTATVPVATPAAATAAFLAALVAWWQLHHTATVAGDQTSGATSSAGSAQPGSGGSTSTSTPGSSGCSASAASTSPAGGHWPFKRAGGC